MDDFPIGSLRPTGRGQEVVVVAPTHCGNGHRLGPGRVEVRFVPCRCDRASDGGHYTWTCSACRHVTWSDGHEGDAVWSSTAG